MGRLRGEYVIAWADDGDAGAEGRRGSWMTRTMVLLGPLVPGSSTTGLPPAVTTKAAAVVLRFILSVKRTDRPAARSMPVAPATGRKRTTLGATTVRTESVGRDRFEGDPVAVGEAQQGLTRIGGVGGQRGVWGEHIVAGGGPRRGRGAGDEGLGLDRGVEPVRRPRGDPRGWANPVPTATNLPTTSSSRGQGGRPGLRLFITAACTGDASAPPSAPRADASTVIVYRVSSRPGGDRGRWWSVLPAASQENVTAASGERRSAWATDAASIGASKPTVIGALRLVAGEDGVEELRRERFGRWTGGSADTCRGLARSRAMAGPARSARLRPRTRPPGTGPPT